MVAIMQGMKPTLRNGATVAIAFLAGAALMAGFYLGLLSWLEGWEYASFQFWRDRAYVIPIVIAFGVQAALYTILRLKLYGPAPSTGTAGVMVGTSGGTSATAMVACCLHHATNVLPILGISAITGFLARYQRSFMELGLLMNVAGIVIMLAALQRARDRSRLLMEAA